MTRLTPLLASLFAAIAGSACSWRYEQRDFEPVGVHTPSGSIFINLVSDGHWRERGVRISGAPYHLVVAPRLHEKPERPCRLTVRSLVLASVSTGETASSRELWALHAEPGRYDQAVGEHFIYAPAEQEYVTSGSLEGLKLAYLPHRLTFELIGDATCPSSARQPVKIDVTLSPKPMSGRANWFDRFTV